MIVAIAMIHGRFGFWMNWTGTQKGEGFEYHLLLIAASAFLFDSRRRSSFGRSSAVLPAESRIQPPDTSTGCLNRKPKVKKSDRMKAPRLWLVIAKSYRALSLSLSGASPTRTVPHGFAALEALLHKGPLTISEIQTKCVWPVAR